MKFTLQMAFSRVRKNLRQYILVALQVALGAGILYTALAMQFSAQSQFNELKGSVENNVVTLSGRSDTEPQPLTQMDYARLIETYPDARGKLAFEGTDQLTVVSGGQEYHVLVFIVSDTYYTALMGMDNADPSKIYYGKDIKDIMADPGLTISSEGSDYGPDAHLLQGIPHTSFLPLEGNRFSQTVRSAEAASFDRSLMGGDGIDRSFDKALIIPVTYMKDTAVNGVLYLPIELDDPDATESLSVQMVETLSGWHPEGTYQYSNPFKNFQGSYQSKLQMANTMMVASVFLFGIMLFGFAGLLILIVNKRKTALAISRMCGARFSRLTAELFIEIAIVVFSGAVVGIVVAVLLMPLQGSLFITTQNSLPAAALSLAGLLGVSLVVSGIGMVKIARVSPVTALHAE